MNYRKHSYGNATQAPCKTCGANAHEACGRDPSVPLDIKAIELKLTKLDAFVVLRALAAYRDEDEAPARDWIAQRLQVGIQAAGWTFTGAEKPGDVTIDAPERCNATCATRRNWTPCRKPAGHEATNDIHADDLGRTWRESKEATPTK